MRHPAVDLDHYQICRSGAIRGNPDGTIARLIRRAGLVFWGAFVGISRSPRRAWRCRQRKA